MAQSSSDSILQQAQLLPTKDTLTALKSDVNLESACLELCDNALDAWKRTSNRAESMTIDIFVQQSQDKTELVIRDDAGGIPREDAAMLFGLGQTAKKEISGSIGTYGVGAKKSLVNLGVPFQISSRTTNATVGWSYRITDEWFEDDQDWTVDIHQNSDIDQGVTEIRIEELNYEWDSETAQILRDRLGETYNLFLSNELEQLHDTRYDLTIRVDGVPVEPKGVEEWSFSPFDGLHPRRYENIQITTPEMEEPVILHITVGLLTKKDSQNAGTDIYCQKRKVASTLRNEDGGFGTGKDQMGNFNARHGRLKVIVELETRGDGQLLPWDTQKSSIDKHNPIMRGTEDSKGVYNWLRRCVKDYFQLDADKVPQAFVEPYDSDHEFAVNDGQPVRLDYSDRKRIVNSHRPDTDLPELSALQKKAAAHATLWISCEDILDRWKAPAYRIQLRQESDRNIENLTPVSELPPAEVEDEPHQIAGKINELARVHLENNIYYPDDLAEWQIPRYQEYIERHDEQTYSNQDAVPKTLPTTPADLSNKSVTTAQDEKRTQNRVHTAKRVDDESIQQEAAELFLVLGGDSDDERVAKVLDISRQDICEKLGLETNVVDEVIWEELEMQLNSILEER
ncbi:ATP-binding protein [Saliphagus sp. GCM10025334]